MNLSKAIWCLQTIPKSDNLGYISQFEREKVIRKHKADDKYERKQGKPVINVWQSVREHKT